MEYLIFGAVIVLFTAWALVSMWAVTEGLDGNLGYFALGAASFVLWFAVGAWALSSALSDDRPCVRHERTMQYNPATKIVMPVTYCAQYGEWEE